MVPTFVSLGFALLSFALGCGGYGRDIGRARAHYDEARYEEALSWLSRLERDVPHMSLQDQAVYHYLSGMSAYRLGRRDQARHELALARELARDREVELGETWTRLMERALAAP